MLKFSEGIYMGTAKPSGGGSAPVIEELNVTPTTSAQVITAGEGVDGYNPVNVSAVTSSIDSNISAGNIKKDVQILGITGTYEGLGEYLVRVIDYDGTVLKEEYLNTGDTFTLPENPTNRPNLTFQEWACPVDITNNTVTVENFDIFIGAVYETTSGLDEYDIVLDNSTGLEIEASGPLGTTIYWGDGTSGTESFHTYADYGSYTIKSDKPLSSIDPYVSLKAARFSASHFNYSGLDVLKSLDYYPSLNYITLPKEVKNASSADFDGSYLKHFILPNNLSSSLTWSIAGNNYIETIVVGKSNNLDISVSLNPSLKYFIIPKGCIKITLNNCYNLNVDVVVPNTVTNIVSMNNLYNIKSLTIPSSVNTIGSSCFTGNYGMKKLDYNTTVELQTNIGYYSLETVILGNNVTSITASAFTNRYTLKKVVLSPNITTIGASAFSNCRSILEYDFSNFQNIPTLSNSNAFNNRNAAVKILVPLSLEASWKAATNWSTLADYIYGV